MVNPARSAIAQLRSGIVSLLSDAGWPAPAWFETMADDPGGSQAGQAVRDGAEIVFACGGELIGPGERLHVRVDPGALEVCVP